MPTVRNPYGSPSPKEKKVSKLEKVVVGLSTRAGLSRLAALFLKDTHEVSLVHFRLGPLTLKALGWDSLGPHQEEEIRRWCEEFSFEFRVHSLEKESDVFLEALALQNLGRCWKPDLGAFFHSQFLLPQLLSYGEKISANRIATGHRTRVSVEKDAGYSLWRSKDLEVDQSYLLSFASKLSWPRVLLPLGHTKAPELERLCREKSLLASKYKDGDLFGELLRKGAWKELIEALDTRALGRVKLPGYAIDPGHHVLGQHSGLLHSSVGSRDALAQGNQVPPDYCVIGFDLMKQWMVLGPPKLLQKKSCLTSRVQWILDWPRLDRDCELEIQVHGSQEMHTGQVRLLLDSMLQVHVSEGPNPFTPKIGDALSLYRGSQCLGSAQVLETFL